MPKKENLEYLLIMCNIEDEDFTKILRGRKVRLRQSEDKRHYILVLDIVRGYRSEVLLVRS